MLYNSIDVISRRYLNEEIYFKIACFDMNHTMDTSAIGCGGSNSNQQTVSIDEESLGIGDEYSVDIGVMNEENHKFHNQELFGHLLQKNEFVICRARIPMTEHIVSSKQSKISIAIFQHSPFPFVRTGSTR